MRKIILSLLSVVFIASPIYPEEKKKTLLKRTGENIVRISRQLAKPITDPKATFSTWFDFNPQIERGERKNYNILPLFVSSPERGQGFGIKYAQESLINKHDVIRIQAIQTVKNSSSYQLKYEFPPDLFGMEFEASYENYEKFYYGVGNTTRKEDESEFSPEIYQIKLPILYGITKNLSTGLTLKYQNWKIIRTDNAGILPRDLPSLTGRESSRHYTTGLLLRWDSRNSKTNPSRGLYVQGDMDYSKKLLGSDSDFKHAKIEGRKFFPVFEDNDRHVFGIRMGLDYRSGDVPFYNLPELGGIYYNRGLIEGRFRDNLSATGNWEYRLRIYNRLHWAFFVDAGNVYSKVRTMELRHTKITGGTGMRYYVPPGNLLLARVDGGYSTEGFQVYLTFDHPF